MNWLLFIVLAYLAVAVQLGLSGLLQIGTRFGAIQPRLELILLAAAAMAGATRPVITACVMLGLAVDLVTTHAGGAIVVGPYTLGFTAAGIVVLQLRLALMGGHPLSIALSVFTAGLTVALVAAGIWTVRAAMLGHPADYSGLTDLTDRLLGSIYTAVIALPLAWPLRRLLPALGGGSPGGGSTMRR